MIIAIIMNQLKIKNPLDKELNLTYKGETFSIGANETGTFSQEVAKKWLEIYGFMTVAGTLEDEVKEKTAQVEVVEEVKEVKKVAKKK